MRVLLISRNPRFSRHVFLINIKHECRSSGLGVARNNLEQSHPRNTTLLSVAPGTNRGETRRNIWTESESRVAGLRRAVKDWLEPMNEKRLKTNIAKENHRYDGHKVSEPPFDRRLQDACLSSFDALCLGCIRNEKGIKKGGPKQKKKYASIDGQ